MSHKLFLGEPETRSTGLVTPRHHASVFACDQEVRAIRVADALARRADPRPSFDRRLVPNRTALRVPGAQRDPWTASRRERDPHLMDVGAACVAAARFCQEPAVLEPSARDVVIEQIFVRLVKGRIDSGRQVVDDRHWRAWMTSCRHGKDQAFQCRQDASTAHTGHITCARLFSHFSGSTPCATMGGQGERG
jgi:hypothetical protein